MSSFLESVAGFLPEQGYPSVAEMSCPEHVEPVVSGIVLGGDNDEENNKLALIINEMCKSAYGRSVIDVAVHNGFKFLFDSSMSEYGYADPDYKECVLNPEFSLPELITTIAHELRHIQQFEQRVTDDCSPQRADAQSNIALMRVMEADAEAYGCVVSWELKEQGITGPWNTFTADFPEIAEPFEQALKDNAGKPDALDQARTAAFLGWYKNVGRREYYDETYVSRLRETKPRFLAKHLRHYDSERLVSDLCQDYGKSYFKADVSILDGDDYISVSNKTKKFLNRFFGEYQRQHPKAENASVAHIPSFDYVPPLEDEFVPVARSVAAKQVSLEIRQKQAVETIRGRRDFMKTSAKLRSQILQRGR